MDSNLAKNTRLNFGKAFSLFVVAAREYSKIAVFSEISLLRGEFNEATLIGIFLSWQTLQMIFAFFFPLISDVIGRKKLLACILPISGVALLLAELQTVLFVLLLLVVDGIFSASITPIGRSAYQDACSSNTRDNASIAVDTLIAQMLPWTSCFIDLVFTNVGIIALISILLCCFGVIFFRDNRDEDSSVEKIKLLTTRSRMLGEIRKIRQKASKEITKTSKKFGMDGLRLFLSFIFHCIAYQYSGFVAQIAI